MATASYRPSRMAGLLKREIAALIQNQVHDPRLEQAWVSDVVVSAGCTHAKIYIYVVGDAQPEEVRSGLSAASGFLRSKLSANLSLRTVPKLVFKIDDSYDQAERIQDILLREAKRI